MVNGWGQLAGLLIVAASLAAQPGDTGKHSCPRWESHERGRFRIDGIPPRRYNVTMWHEGFVQKGFDKDGRPLYDEPRRVIAEVTIPPRGTAVANFELR